MAEWSTLAEVGTAAGTLVLAAATFAAVRSANRTAKAAEQTLLAAQRPALVTAEPEDPAQDVLFADERLFSVGGGVGLVHRDCDVIYLAVTLRNVGTGLAVLQGYRLEADGADRLAASPLAATRHMRGDRPPPTSEFRRQQRDLYVAAGRAGFWQAALRDVEDPLHRSTSEAIATGGRITIDVLYGDHDDGQQSVTRIVLLPGEGDNWRADVTRHWRLDHSASG
jgi:hypothetical protein